MATVYECQGWNTTTTLSHLGGSIVESAAITAGGGRLVGNRLSAPNNNDYWSKSSIFSVAAGNPIAWGFAFFYTSIPSSTSVIFGLAGVSTTRLQIDSGGFLQLIAGSAGTFSTRELLRGIWYYIEVKMLYSATVGTYEVRVNGEVWLSGSGANTGSGTASGYDIGACYGSGTTALGGAGWDDFYVASDFLGDVRVDTIYPSAEGTTIQWTPSTGTDNSALIDETPPVDTDYNSEATLNEKDTYAFGNLPVAGTVHAIKIKMRALKTDAGARSIASVTRSGGTDYLGANKALAVSALYYDELQNVNPDTAAQWTDTEVDAAEFGVQVTV